MTVDRQILKTIIKENNPIKSKNDSFCSYFRDNLKLLSLITAASVNGPKCAYYTYFSYDTLSAREVHLGANNDVGNDWFDDVGNDGLNV